jgi:hypothetical protein
MALLATNLAGMDQLPLLALLFVGYGFGLVVPTNSGAGAG